MSRTAPARLAGGLSFAGLALAAACGDAEPDRPGPMAQNPSPMVERTRAHGRLPDTPPPGTRLELDAGLGTPVRLYLPPSDRDPERLLVHFHGAAYVPEHAVHDAPGRTWALATVHLGAGSGVYDRAFAEPAAFTRLLHRVRAAVEEELGPDAAPDDVVLSGFSAGCAAIRAILRDPRAADTVDAALLLDGIHTGYLPPRTPLADGGRLDTEPLASLEAFARRALAGEKTMLVTHSEIFPGTFVSTTETADWLLDRLGLERTPVLAWGPVGMQQLSDTRAGGFRLMGFAGNTAPDHVDHFHGMAGWLSPGTAARP